MADEATATSTMTRRQMLKRAGIGAAAAWTAPMLLGATPAAHAAGAKKCAAIGKANGVSSCTSCPACETPCGPGGFTDQSCCCFALPSGCCHCGTNANCASIPACTSNAGCPKGWKCVWTCCDAGKRCVPPCGTPAGKTSGASSGRRAGQRAA